MTVASVAAVTVKFRIDTLSVVPTRMFSDIS